MGVKHLISMSCLIVSLTVAHANAATITYDGTNRPTLFEDIAVDWGGTIGTLHYDVEVTWDSTSFNDVYGFSNDDAYYLANSSLIAWGSVTDANTTLGALITALDSYGFTGTSTAKSQYLVVPYALNYNTDWVYSSVVDLKNGTGSEIFVGTVIRSTIYSDSGWTQWTEIAAPVPVPGAFWLFGSSLIGLIGIARRKKA